MLRSGFLSLLLLWAVCGAADAQETSPFGLFEAQSDVGTVLHPGSAEYDATTKVYTVTGSGENMWFNKDDFHFVWKKISADDLMLTADIGIVGTDGNAHRKGVLMIRQSLDEDSAYADVARHGEGLTSLQFRERKGGTTHEVESYVSGPAKLRIEKLGDRFYMWVAQGEKDNLQFAGGSGWVEMRDPFYVGIGVCAHDKDATEKVTFSHVELETVFKRSKIKGKFSTVETVLLSGDARTGYVSSKHVSSAGWSADGHALTFEEEGKPGETPFSPLRTAAPVGMPLSSNTVDFTYFTSKSGDTMQIWRKSGDGSQTSQFTPEDFNNVSPHVSPDGKYLAFLSYSREYSKLGENTPLQLRLMLLSDNSIKTLVTFVGGPNSLGDNPWSPDGKRIVFVSYQVMK